MAKKYTTEQLTKSFQDGMASTSYSARWSIPEGSLRKFWEAGWIASEKENSPEVEEDIEEEIK